MPAAEINNAYPDAAVEEEFVDLADLIPHPRNYQQHPEDQIVHLVESIREYGFVRNIVIARDNTILAGHGTVEAATRVGLHSVPVRRLDLDPMEPAALKFLALDNEISRFAVRDDRALSELLRELNETAEQGLFGTGYDQQMLANLIMVTRPAHEIEDANAAAQWVGMPEFVDPGKPVEVIIRFDSPEDRDRLIALLEITQLRQQSNNRWAMWWPPRDREDKVNAFFDA